jgi:hypothetical protein
MVPPWTASSVSPFSPDKQYLFTPHQVRCFSDRTSQASKKQKVLKVKSRLATDSCKVVLEHKVAIKLPTHSRASKPRCGHVPRYAANMGTWRLCVG